MEFSISDQKKKITTDLVNVCIERDTLSKLEVSTDFFKSKFWKNLTCMSEDKAHEFANDFLKQSFGKDKFMIFDDGRPIYDSGELYQKMNVNEQAFLEEIESSKRKGLFIKGNFVYQYIGSTAVYLVSSNGEINIELASSDDVITFYISQYIEGNKHNQTAIGTGQVTASSTPGYANLDLKWKVGHYNDKGVYQYGDVTFTGPFIQAFNNIMLPEGYSLASSTTLTFSNNVTITYIPNQDGTVNVIFNMPTDATINNGDEYLYPNLFKINT